ncbi:MAG: hypothetical protein C0410_01895 [Anaerolinea sp.]|nr:hypothetical protein [Anaerolinea sp.]
MILILIIMKLCLNMMKPNANYAKQVVNKNNLSLLVGKKHSEKTPKGLIRRFFNNQFSKSQKMIFKVIVSKK